MNSEPRYRKVEQGKRHRYEKIEEHFYDMDNLPIGAHLIVVHPGGGRSYRIVIDPDKAAVLAAIKQCQHAMEEAMRERNRYQMEYYRRPHTWLQNRALDEYLKLRGESLTVFKGCTMYDIIEAGIKVLEGKI